MSRTSKLLISHSPPLPQKASGSVPTTAAEKEASRELAPPRGQQPVGTWAQFGTSPPVSPRRPIQAEPHTTPFRIGRAGNPGAGSKAERSMGLATLADRRAAHRAGLPVAQAGRRADPSPRVPCQSLALCGFLGDVAPPAARASFRLV